MAQHHDPNTSKRSNRGRSGRGGRANRPHRMSPPGTTTWTQHDQFGSMEPPKLNYNAPNFTPQSDYTQGTNSQMSRPPMHHQPRSSEGTRTSKNPPIDKPQNQAAQASAKQRICSSTRRPPKSSESTRTYGNILPDTPDSRDAEIARLELELDAAKSSASREGLGYRNKIHELEKAQKAGLSGTESKLKAEIVSLKQTLRDSREDYQNAAMEAGRRLERIRQLEAAQKGSIHEREVSNMMQAKNTKIATLIAQVDEAKKTAESAQQAEIAALNNLKSSQDQLQQARTAATTKISELKSQINQMEKEAVGIIRSLEEQSKQAQKPNPCPGCADLQDKLHLNERKFAQAEREHNDILDKQQEKLQRVQKEQRAAYRLVNESNANHQRVSAELKALRKQHENCSKTDQSSSKSFLARFSETTGPEPSISDLRHQIGQLQDDLSMAQNLADDATKREAEAREHVASLRTELAECQTKVQKSQTRAQDALNASTDDLPENDTKAGIPDPGSLGEEGTRRLQGGTAQLQRQLDNETAEAKAQTRSTADEAFGVNDTEFRDLLKLDQPQGTTEKDTYTKTEDGAITDATALRARLATSRAEVFTLKIDLEKYQQYVKDAVSCFDENEKRFKKLKLDFEKTDEKLRRYVAAVKNPSDGTKSYSKQRKQNKGNYKINVYHYSLPSSRISFQFKKAGRVMKKLSSAQLDKGNEALPETPDEASPVSPAAAMQSPPKKEKPNKSLQGSTPTIEPTTSQFHTAPPPALRPGVSRIGTMKLPALKPVQFPRTNELISPAPLTTDELAHLIKITGRFQPMEREKSRRERWAAEAEARRERSKMLKDWASHYMKTIVETYQNGEFEGEVVDLGQGLRDRLFQETEELINEYNNRFENIMRDLKTLKEQREQRVALEIDFKAACDGLRSAYEKAKTDLTELVRDHEKMAALKQAHGQSIATSSRSRDTLSFSKDTSSPFEETSVQSAMTATQLRWRGKGRASNPDIKSLDYAKMEANRKVSEYNARMIAEMDARKGTRPRNTVMVDLKEEFELMMGNIPSAHRRSNQAYLGDLDDKDEDDDEDEDEGML